MDSNCCSEPVSYAAVEEDYIHGLVIMIFDDLDKVGADVVLLHGCQQSCMPNPVEGLLEVYEDIVEVLLVLEIFLAKDSYVEDLLYDAPSCHETCLFFSNDLLRFCSLNLFSVIFSMTLLGWLMRLIVR